MWDQSILVWHELAEVRPELVTAHVQLGEAFAAAAFPDEAIDAWKPALELDPRESRAMYNLAVAALKREGMATALPGFRKAGELDPSQDDFFFSLAGVYDDGVPAPDPDDGAPTTGRAALGRLRARVRGAVLLGGRAHPGDPRPTTRRTPRRSRSRASST